MVLCTSVIYVQKLRSMRHHYAEIYPQVKEAFDDRQTLEGQLRNLQAGLVEGQEAARQEGRQEVERLESRLKDFLKDRSVVHVMQSIGRSYDGGRKRGSTAFLCALLGERKLINVRMKWNATQRQANQSLYASRSVASAELV